MARNMYSQSAYVLSDMGDSDDFELQAQQQRAALARREYLGDFKYRNDPHSRAKGSRHYYFNKEQLHDLARRTVQLVPIRLDLEVEGVKLRDQFTWNLNETLITPEQFATLLADDFDSPYAHQFVPLIAEEIRRQVQNYGVAAEEDPDAEGKPRIKVDENDETAYGELRIAVKLDLNVGTLHLTDQFEWPLFSTSSMTPEDFAKQLASDLGVGGEFVPVIAHAIREQVCFARMNYNDATPAPPLRGRPFRAENVEDEWEPELRELTEEDIERIVKEKERNTRRLRRQHRQTLGRNTSTAATTPYPQRSDTPQSTGFRDRPSRATNSIYASNRPPLRGSNLNEYAASPGPEPTPAPTRERYAASPAPAPIQRYASADVPDVPQHAVQPHVNSTSVPQQAYTPHPSHSGTQMQNFTPVAPVASHPLYSMESNYTHQQYPYPFATSTASIPPSSLPAYSGLSILHYPQHPFELRSLLTRSHKGQ
ncbi:uncharacterized protein EV422DRAFT_146468 [Fimicolochytrium jonesii]|uniref:uncharacterized protein n=1 Tax=Fimicolochytrium jonesii TaxID=1396493 RepID=UPI0022FDF32D|nr:uncharacterized protein EV422DRAFT_146468 [Fimicolochytrium jonesii]KAI8825934.1 hypothetical protein EV422DRAFT_146468 [Fimicolochytrium jonesii]